MPVVAFWLLSLCLAVPAVGGESFDSFQGTDVGPDSAPFAQAPGSPDYFQPGFDPKYERDYNIFNPATRYRSDNPLNPAATYAPDNPFNPANQFDPGNPANPANLFLPSNPFNPANRFDPENPLNPANRYNPATPFQPLHRSRSPQP